MTTTASNKNNIWVTLLALTDKQADAFMTLNDFRVAIGKKPLTVEQFLKQNAKIAA